MVLFLPTPTVIGLMSFLCEVCKAKNTDVQQVKMAGNSTDVIRTSGKCCPVSGRFLPSTVKLPEERQRIGKEITPPATVVKGHRYYSRNETYQWRAIAVSGCRQLAHLPVVLLVIL